MPPLTDEDVRRITELTGMTEPALRQAMTEGDLTEYLWDGRNILWFDDGEGGFWSFDCTEHRMLFDLEVLEAKADLL